MLKNKLLIIFILALVLRFSLVFVAHHGDLNNNITWGTIAVEKGLNGFYDDGNSDNWPYSAPNQPPLTILMFAGVRAFWQIIENTSWWLNNNLGVFPSAFIWFWEGRGMELLVKLPSIVADLGIGYLIYKYFSDKKKNNLGTTLAAVWLFNPITWYNSSIWGQTDALVNLLGLISIIYLLKNNLSRFVIFYALSIMFKGSLMIFAPILLLVAIKQKYARLDWIKAGVGGFLVAIIASIWFHPKLDLLIWLFDLYKNRILPGEIGYLTANAFNFWWLVNPGKVLDSTVYLGFPARAWGLAIFAAGYLCTTYWLLKNKLSDKRVFMVLVLVSLMSFLFMTRIHERYLYPFFPIGTILLGLVPAVVLPYIIYSVIHLLNLYHLFWAPPIAFLEGLYTKLTFTNILSVINLFVFAWISWVLVESNQSRK